MWQERQHPRGQAGNAGQFRQAENSAPQGRLQSPSHRFTRDELVFGLNAVVAKLRRIGKPASIRIVGGAAISMFYWAQRGGTQDIDAELGPADVVLDAATQAATENDWPSDWLNNKAEMFLPGGFAGRSAEWVTVYDTDGVVVQIASADTLLAMKLNAAITRGRREIADVALLLNRCGINTVDGAESHFRDYYGEDLNDRAIRVVNAALAIDTRGMTAEELDMSGA